MRTNLADFDITDPIKIAQLILDRDGDCKFLDCVSCPLYNIDCGSQYNYETITKPYLTKYVRKEKLKRILNEN